VEVPVSAYGGSLKNLKDLKEEIDDGSKCRADDAEASNELLGSAWECDARWRAAGPRGSSVGYADTVACRTPSKPPSVGSRAPFGAQSSCPVSWDHAGFTLREVFWDKAGSPRQEWVVDPEALADVPVSRGTSSQADSPLPAVQGNVCSGSLSSVDPETSWLASYLEEGHAKGPRTSRRLSGQRDALRQEFGQPPAPMPPSSFVSLPYWTVFSPPPPGTDLAATPWCGAEALGQLGGAGASRGGGGGGGNMPSVAPPGPPVGSFSTLDPKPQSLSPKPETLNPEPEL